MDLQQTLASGRWFRIFGRSLLLLNAGPEGIGPDQPERESEARDHNFRPAELWPETAVFHASYLISIKEMSDAAG